MSRARKLADCDKWAGPWQLSKDQWIRPYYCQMLKEHIARYGPIVVTYKLNGRNRDMVWTQRKQRDASVEA